MKLETQFSFSTRRYHHQSQLPVPSFHTFQYAGVSILERQIVRARSLLNLHLGVCNPKSFDFVDAFHLRLSIKAIK